MDGNLLHRGPPGEFSGIAFGVARFDDADIAGGVRREPMTVEFDFDRLTLDFFRRLLPRALARFESAGESVGFDELRSAWLSWSFPDGRGTVLAWALSDGTGGLLIEFGLARELTFRQILELDPESLSDVADVILPEVDNLACFEHLGRVFSIRERWAEMLAGFLRSGAKGAVVEEVAPGYSICARRQDAQATAPTATLAWGAEDVQCIPLPRRASADAGADEESPLERRLAAVARDIRLEVYVSPGTLISGWRRAAGEAGLELQEIPHVDGPRIRLTNELGYSLDFQLREVMRRAAVDVHTLGEQAVMQQLAEASILAQQVSFVRGLEEALPPEFETDAPAPDGFLRVHHQDEGTRLLDLWTLPRQFDLEESSSRRQLLELLHSAAPGPVDRSLQRVVRKELHSRAWLRSHLRQAAAAGLPPPLVRARANLVEILSNGVRFEGSPNDSEDALRQGDHDTAERLWQEQLDASQWQARCMVVRVGRLLPHRVLLLAGPGIADAVLHPSLLRGLCDAAGFAVGRRAHVFAPRSGLLVLAPGWTPTIALRRVAYRFFVDHARDQLSHILGDTLHFRARIELPPQGQGLGTFSLRPLDDSWILSA